MQEEWRSIAEFPNYSVSDTGLVRNDETDRVMAKLINQHGIVHVSLQKDRVQYKRSLAVLVAEAFLAPPGKDFEGFDTPINLDGDRYNNHVHNLMWRPRHFATKYFRQFHQYHPGIGRPIEVIETGERFESSWHAAITLGVLDREVTFSILSTSYYVWPLFTRFQLFRK